MRKLLFLIILLPCLSHAEGPLFRHKDTYEQQEDDNIYSDLRKKASLSILTNNTSGQYLTGQGNGINPIWTSPFKILQAPVFCEANTSSSTTTSSFINTTLSCSITPISSSSRILVLASGNLNHSASGFSGVATLARGTTNLSANNNGMCEVNITATGFGGAIVPCAMRAWDDHQSLTTSTTYRVQIKTVSGSGSTGWSAGNTTRSEMILFEIGQ